MIQPVGIRDRLSGYWNSLQAPRDAEKFRKWVIGQKEVNKNMRINHTDTTIKYIEEEAKEVVDAYYKHPETLASEMGDLGATLEILAQNLPFSYPSQQSINVRNAFYRLKKRILKTKEYLDQTGDWAKSYKRVKHEEMVAAGLIKEGPSLYV